MVEHDGMVGQLLKKLDDLGIADNTIVVYTTDNGAEVMTWPDGGSTPFRGEKATNWEGGFRVPMCIRWPGVIKPGTIVNDMCAHEDLIPTFAAAAGEPDLVEKVKKGYQAGGEELQGPPRRLQPDPVPQGRGEGVAAEGVPLLERRRRADGHPRQPLEGRVHGAAATTGLAVWREEFTKLRMPKLYNLRADPFERGDTSLSTTTSGWRIGRSLIVAQAIAAQWLSSFKEFPPRQKPASFNLDEVIEKLTPKQ